MSRKTRSFGSNGPTIRPIQKIELSDINIKRRIIFVALLFVISVVSLGYGFNQLLTANQGWQQISVTSSLINCGDDFVFTYNLGAGDTDPTEEKKRLISTYSELCVNAYNDFCGDGEIEGVNNVYYINNHPNEEVLVSASLYKAFEKLSAADNRLIYLAPVYEMYDDIFACTDDSQATAFDPYADEEVKMLYQQMSDYARNPEAVNVELLGDNKVKLVVSDEYMSYAKSEYISRYIDFFWMRNAFACDYIADGLIEAGYTHGSLSSFDGFHRCLDSSDTSYSYNIMAKLEGDENTYSAAIMKYSGQTSFVYMRDYIATSMDKRYFYQYRDGRTRNSYIDIETGMCKSSASGVLAYSNLASCVDILMEMIPIYIADDFQADKLESLADREIYTVYNDGTDLFVSDKDIVLSEIYDKGGIKFTLK